MRVLITSGIFPPDIGGPSRMIERLASDLSYRGIDVVILTFGAADGADRPYQVVRAAGKLSFAGKLLKLGRQADIIYTFDLYTAGFLSWLICKKILGKKLAVRFAGDSAWESAYNKGKTADDILTFQDKNYGLKIWLMKKVRSWILRDADKVVAVSNFMKELAMKIGAQSAKVEVIYNAVDFLRPSATHRPNRREELGLPSESKVVLTAARLVPWKGIDGLMTAVAELKAVLPQLTLLIVGEGQDRPRLEKLREELGLRETVLFVGLASLNEIFDYYNLADVFILNSRYEGLSHILLEVLTLGKPIVASACGGNPEVIENERNGLLVEYNNVGQLAVAIKRILTEEKWQSAEFKNACQESLKKFNWKENVEKTIRILNDCRQMSS